MQSIKRARHFPANVRLLRQSLTSSRTGATRRHWANVPTVRTTKFSAMAVTNVLETKPRRRRTWRQFRLRTLFVAVTVASLSMWGWNAYMAPYRLQREATAVFQAAGGSVDTRTSGPRWMRYLAGDKYFQDVVGVDLGDCQVTDECLEWLTRLPHVETIVIGGHSPGRLTGIAHRAGLLNVEYLNLNNTKVSDDGLSILRDMTRLKTLWLNNTGITDEGLEHLKGLHTLTVIWLVNTHTTDEGVEALRDSLPDAYILH